MPYYVEIISPAEGNEKILLHDPYSDTVKLYSGKVHSVKNAASDFQFSILPNHPLFYDEDNLSPFITLIRVIDVNGDFVFRGRIIDITHKMDPNGLPVREFVAEDELAYLVDSMQRHGEYHNISPKDYLQVMIDKHNETMIFFYFDTPPIQELTYYDKYFELGTVDVTDPNDEIYRYLAYDTTLANIQDDLIRSHGGYLSVRHTDGVRYLDYTVESGTTSTMSIELAKNLISIESEYLASEVITRLIPLGAEYEDVPLAIRRLTLYGLLDSPDYWLGIYPSLTWLGQLFTNLSKLAYDTSKSNGITTVSAAIDFLQEAGAIHTPEYWHENYTKITNLNNLLIKSANYVDTTRTTVFADAALPRLTVASVNYGFDYITDNAARAKYGDIEGIVKWDDVTVADNLLARGKQWLADQIIPNSVSITALELSLIDESYERFKVGNRYRADNDILGMM